MRGEHLRDGHVVVDEIAFRDPLVRPEDLARFVSRSSLIPVACLPGAALRRTFSFFSPVFDGFTVVITTRG